MAVIELVGVLHEKADSEYVGEKKTFQKRFFILEENTPGREGKMYTELIKFNLVADKCNDIDDYAIGDRLYVKAVIKGTRWESKDDGRVIWFTELRVISLHPADAEGLGNTEDGDDPDSVYINKNDLTQDDLLLDLDKKEEKTEENTLFTSDIDDLPFVLTIPLVIGFLTQFMIL